MVTYDSSSIYISSAADLQTKINRIDTIINALLDAALQHAGNSGYIAYTINDGQSIINMQYRDMAALQKSIAAYETMKELYVNKLNGRVMRLVGSKNLINNGYNR
jgi:quinol monooxygenase YgiN